ncbi:MAG TPA: hypothetical protein VK454_12910 [Myxococcaceae bacterium]|nr:hypothetical protein [Myxococcaceae bacterium]
MDLSAVRRAVVPAVFPLLVVALPARAQTEEPPAAVASDAGEQHPQPAGGHQELSDLGILNFFSEGWNVKWVHRHRYTPDMALLKVTTNFLEQEFRLDYANTQIANNTTLVASDLLNGLIAYALNRRFMLEIIANYQWNIKKSGSPANGAGGGFLVRFQLVDNPTQSYDFQVRISGPNRPIGQTQTSMQYSLSGWQDMHALIPALGRFGLYYSFTYENLLGPLPKAGARSNDISYDISFAETWTSPDVPVVGNFTTFVEFFGTTDLDGTSTTPTVISVTPGVRFWLIPKNSLTLGLELPLVSTPPFNIIYRLTYILNF